MRSQYCSKVSGVVSRDMSDGSKIGMCKKGWSVFYATLRSKGWDETKPHPKNTTQETINQAITETKNNIVKWFEKQYPIGGVINASKKPMETRSGLQSSSGRVFALTNDVKSEEQKKKEEIIKWYESRYKKEECGCGEK